MFLLIGLVFLVLVLVLYYLTGNYNENYWKKRRVVFYSKNKILGPIWDFMRKDIALFQSFHNLYKLYPGEPAVGIGSILRPAIYITNLENVQHVLQGDFRSFNHRGVEFAEADLLADHVLFQNGSRWKVMRQAMTPLFTNNKLKNMYYIIDKCAKDFVTYLKEEDPRKLECDIFDTLTHFCGAAVSGAIFNITTKSIFDSPFLDMARSAVAPTTARNLKFALASISDGLKKFNIKLFSEYEEFFIGAIKQLIRQREKENKKKHDFADLCVALQKNGILKDPETGFELEPTDELLAAQAFFYYVAGVDPTASAIYATLFELGNHQEILQKALDEIDCIWSKHNGNITFDVINEMEYIDKVLNEALRMHPPIGFLSRMCVKDSILPVGNIKIDAGTKVFTPVYEIHHDPQYFPNPEVFDPERFANNEKQRFESAYMPFGKGGRHCIGLRYARLQAKAGIIYVLRHFEPKTTILPGGLKYSKQQVQVRISNVKVKLIARNI